MLLFYACAIINTGKSIFILTKLEARCSTNLRRSFILPQLWLSEICSMQMSWIISKYKVKWKRRPRCVKHITNSWQRCCPTFHVQLRFVTSRSIGQRLRCNRYWTKTPRRRTILVEWVRSERTTGVDCTLASLSAGQIDSHVRARLSPRRPSGDNNWKNTF